MSLLWINKKEQLVYLAKLDMIIVNLAFASDFTSQSLLL